MGNHVEHIDEGALAELREVMEEEFPFLIETFLNDSVSRIEQIESALQAGLATDFSRACHSFKGSCINIGLHQLAELCRQGELMGHNHELAGAHQLLQAIRDEFALVRTLLPQYLQ